jgi:hypothetical protein
MTVLAILIAVAVVAITATVVALLRDGYRRIPACRTSTLEP